MALNPGTRLASYEITGPLGAGGMGEVYRAKDTKLCRDVALKVLPRKFIQDPDRLARFEREARLLASLNHPNIAAIHGLEQSEETRYLVLELVEGATLAERLRRGRLTVSETLEVSLQIAQGMAAAHRQGIIHRDLKPSNVKITPEGRVKILDFGLAKAFADETPDSKEPDSPTITADMTRAGAILGTAAYMSPEQARGQPVDRRADIWAFGVLVWEMLTGKQIFARPNVTDTLAAVVGLEPTWIDLPDATPNALRRLLRRSLQKEPQRRLHDIADARLDVEEAAAEINDTEPPVETRPQVSTMQQLRGAWWVLLAAVGMGAAAAWITWMFLAPTGTLQTATRVDIRLPPGVFVDAERARPGVAISPDGRWVVFVAVEDGTRKLFKRSLDRFEITSIPGTDHARFAFFSPDGRWIGFWEDDQDQMKKVALDGGVPVVLCEAPNAWGATWGTNRRIVFGHGTLRGLWQVSDAGGEPELLLPPSPETGETNYLLPEFLPDGQAVLYTIWRAGFTAASAQIGVLELATGEQKVLLDRAASARYLPTGHLVFGRGGRAEIVPFDLESREVTGISVPVPEPIFYEPAGKLHLAVSNTGTLAFIPDGSAPQRQIAYADLQGQREFAPGNPRGYQYPRFSPDGRRLAVTISEFGEPSIWVLEQTTGVQTQLPGAGRRNFPLWTPDGQRIAFSLETQQPPASWSIFWQPAGASRPPEPLVMAPGTGEWLWPSSWTPDGQVLVIGRWLVGSSKDIYYVSLDKPKELQPFLATTANEYNGLLSPDGHWMAYTSDETGSFAIYVQQFPEGGDRHQISTGETTALVGWTPDGSKIYYLFEGQMMEVGITLEPVFRADTPRALFDLQHYIGVWYWPDVQLSPDGERFVMITPDETWGVAEEIRIVLNWFEGLEELFSSGE